MEDSILVTIKKLLGHFAEDEDFDTDIITEINTAFAVLQQLGVGPSDGFEITGTTEKWSDYTNNVKMLNMLKTYIKSKVKLVFDPPLNSSVLQSVKETIAEYEWRLFSMYNPSDTYDEEPTT